MNEYKIPYKVFENIISITAAKIAEGKIIGWFSGKMEFGPRALGSRSILADPRKPEMKDILNEKIKLRESFRPFAPMVLDEYANQFFELQDANYDTMMITAQVKPGAEAMMPAVIHQDGTARIQLVSKESNADIYQLLKAFHPVYVQHVNVHPVVPPVQETVCAPVAGDKRYKISTLFPAASVLEPKDVIAVPP